MGQILATFGRPLLVIMIIWAGHISSLFWLFYIKIFVFDCILIFLGYGRVSSFILLLQLFVLVSNVVAVQGMCPLVFVLNIY